jgi:hypothetical protein
MIKLGFPVAWRWKWHTFSEWQYGSKVPNTTAVYYKLQPLYLNPVESEID